MRPCEHYRAAEALLAEGREVVTRISELNHTRPAGDSHARDRYTAHMDELGKKVLGIWAQAQVHATLATLVDATGCCSDDPYGTRPDA